jgi:16S rRNA (cytidine1402-2'-O)-methyltransferase
LTKIHEEFLRATVAEARRELAARDRIRGEITLLVEALPQPPSGSREETPTGKKISRQLAQLVAELGIDEKDALKRLARELGQSKSELYRELQRERSQLKTRIR